MNPEPTICTRDIIVSMLATLALLIGVSVLVVAGLGVIFESEIPTSVLSASLLVANPLVLGVCGLFFARQAFLPLRGFLGFSRPQWFWMFPGVIFAGQLSDGLYRWIQSNAQDLDGGAVDSLASAVQEPGLAGGFILLGALVLAPVGEELFFRGWIWGAVRRYNSAVVAILVSGVAFAGYHMDPAHALALLPLAVWLSWLRWATNSIWPCIWAHALNNGLWVLGIRFGSDIGWLAEPMPGWFTLLSLLALCGMMGWVHRRKPW
jgi:membrane protease YdiL (CAAX protease family)